MFRCFKDSLIKPKFIANHLNMKVILFICYALFLALLLAIPFYINYFTDNSVPSSFATTITEDLDNNTDYLPYAIKDNKLIATDDKSTLMIVSLPNVSKVNQITLMPVYMVFNPLDGIVELSDQYAIFIVFGKTKLEILSNTGGNKSYNPEIMEISTTNINKSFVSYTYKEIEANGLDFNEVNNYSNYAFNLTLTKIIEKIYKPYEVWVNIIVIPFIYISSIISLLIEVLLISGFVAIFYRLLKIKFINILKLTLLCMTPMVVLSIIGLLPLGQIWIYTWNLIGQIVTIVYLLIAIRMVAGINIYNNNNQQ